MEQTSPGSASDSGWLFHGRRAGPGRSPQPGSARGNPSQERIRSRRRRLWGTLLGASGKLSAIVAITLLLGCGNPFAGPVQLEFQVLPTDVADCDSRRGELQFYISDLTMIDSTGAAVPVRLDDRNPWQGESTALISLNFGCAESPESGNRMVSGSVARGHYAAVEFSLGVPFEHNHLNPMRAAPPLNVPSMFWTWQTGYKFLRLDLGNAWSFHLGSTGCVSDSAMRPPQQPCRQPNVARIRLPAEAAQDGNVLIDLDALLAGIDTASAGNCVAAYRKRGACRGLLGALGLDADTGQCFENLQPGERHPSQGSSCASQSVFRLDGD